MNLLRILFAIIFLGVSTGFGDSIHPDLQTAMDKAKPDEVVSALIYLPQQVNLSQLDAQLKLQKSTLKARHEMVVRKLRQTADQSQIALLEHLEQLKIDGGNVDYKRLWIVNAILVSASCETIEELSQRVDIKTIYLDYGIELIQPLEGKNRIQDIAVGDKGSGGAAAGAGSIEPGIAAIRAPEVWALGITGQNVLVSSLDTGVQGTHPALANRWVGVANAAYANNPEWAWFDPVTSTSFPQLFGSIHGTHTMGTICGGAPGDQIGVAPGANWIHAAVIDRVGIQQTISDAILAFQWIADPDGNAETNFDVPCACCNSWGLADFHGVPDCDQGFWQFIDACEAAGVVVVFAAGNEGGGGLRRPSDRATDDYRTFSIAAVDGNTGSFPIAGFSSRGPTFCTPTGQAAIKPDVAAPGVDVRSAAQGSSYAFLSGTSMAAPHITGVVALIRQANPNLTVDEIKQIMFDSAADLGSFGEDNTFGWGIVDAFEAVQIAISMKVVLGDLNLDGNVNLLDVGPFVDLLGSGMFQAEADINQDGEVNLLDVGPFVALLGSQ